MIVTLNLHTTLQRPSPEGWIRQIQVELPPGVTLGELLARQGLVIDLAHYLLVVNSRNVEASQILADGDVIHVIPAIAGG